MLWEVVKTIIIPVMAEEEEEEDMGISILGERDMVGRIAVAVLACEDRIWDFGLGWQRLLYRRVCQVW